MPILSSLLTVATIFSAPELNTACIHAIADARFEITATVASVASDLSGTINVIDSNGYALSIVMSKRDSTRRPGDLVRISGTTRLHHKFHAAIPVGSTINFLSHDSPPIPPTVSADDLKSGRADNRFVQISGTVYECFLDENDPDYIYLVIGDPETIFAAILSPSGQAEHDKLFASLQDLVGAEISIASIYVPSRAIVRNLAKRMIFPFLSFDAIKVHRHPPEDPFSVPVLGNTDALNASDIPNLGRMKTIGTVLSTWNGNQILVRGDDGAIHRALVANGQLPHVGELIEVAGRAETDLYNVNFANAVWRKCPGQPRQPNAAAKEISAGQLFRDAHGNKMLNACYHGRRLKMNGVVQELLKTPDGQRTMLLLDGDCVIRINATAATGRIDVIEKGCHVEVSGTCIVETGVWLPNSEFPHATGITLVTDGPNDIRIVAHAPWLTRQYLLIAAGLFLSIIVVFLLWNLSLRLLVERRGRQLFKEQISRAKSEIHAEERMNLAIELHDSLSQNLTGIAFQINMANRLVEERQDALKHNLLIAMRALQSCRDELKNCIYDLRNQALDNPDINEAVRITLRPYLDRTHLRVRLNIPRSRLSDHTTHAMIKIIRELTANALRHGNAQNINIAGAIDNGQLLFSVRDDGCGFDPSHIPGPEHGHFGLQGISERIRPFDGKMSIASEDGGGTRVVISLKLYLPENTATDT